MKNDISSPLDGCLDDREMRTARKGIHTLKQEGNGCRLPGPHPWGLPGLPCRQPVTKEGKVGKQWQHARQSKEWRAEGLAQQHPKEW